MMYKYSWSLIINQTCTQLLPDPQILISHKQWSGQHRMTCTCVRVTWKPHICFLFILTGILWYDSWAKYCITDMCIIVNGGLVVRFVYKPHMFGFPNIKNGLRFLSCQATSVILLQLLIFIFTCVYIQLWKDCFQLNLLYIGMCWSQIIIVVSLCELWQHFHMLYSLFG